MVIAASPLCFQGVFAFLLTPGACLICGEGDVPKLNRHGEISTPQAQLPRRDVHPLKLTGRVKRERARQISAHYKLNYHGEKYPPVSSSLTAERDVPSLKFNHHRQRYPPLKFNRLTPAGHLNQPRPVSSMQAQTCIYECWPPPYLEWSDSSSSKLRSTWPRLDSLTFGSHVPALDPPPIGTRAYQWTLSIGQTETCFHLLPP